MRPFYFALPLLAVLVITTLYLNYSPFSAGRGANCALNKEKCVFEQAGVQFSAKIEPLPIKIEEPQWLFLEQPIGYKIVNAWIEGTNMYMGKNKLWVPKNQSSGQTKLQFTLGACAEPKMRWKLVVEYQHEHSDTTNSIHYFFQTKGF